MDYIRYCQNLTQRKCAVKAVDQKVISFFSLKITVCLIKVERSTGLSKVAQVFLFAVIWPKKICDRFYR